MTNTIVEGGGLNDFVSHLKILKTNIGANLFAIGGVLKEIKDQKLYEEQYETFNEFLGDPAVSMNRGVAHKAITIYEVFSSCKHDNLYDIDQDKLYLLAPNVKAEPDKLEHFIADARLLSRSDLREKYGKRVKPSVALADKIKQFIKDMFPSLRKSQKELLAEGIKAWENYPV
jgi:hypothetical protein